MLLLEDFNEFRDQCHTASVNAGWWKGTERYPWTHEKHGVSAYDPDRLTVPTKLCLIHSEISEAYEFYLSGANDDHLPHLPGALVEFGDTIIRIGDLAGYLEIDLTSAIALVLQIDHIEVVGPAVHHGGRVYVGASAMHMLLTTWTSGAMESYRKQSNGWTRADQIVPALSGVAANLARIVILCKLISEKNGWDLMDAAQQKIAYNATREDHKAEVRALDGGKAF